MNFTTQKESLPVGCNHAAGFPKHNDQASLPDSPGTVNPTVVDHLRERAAASQAQLLAKAATFASGHAPHTLWQRRMGTGAAMVLVRLEWPGTLAVFDPKTGNLLARSAPGAPGLLQKQELSRQ